MEKQHSYSRKALEFRKILNWAARPFIEIQGKKSYFQSKETDINKISYSDAHDLVIVACGGTFIYFEGNVAYVRAYSIDGKERWTIQKPLPQPEKSGGIHAGFTGLFAEVNQFSGGRYATVYSRHDRPSFDIIDLATGTTVVSLPGQPIATSAKASRILIRTVTGELMLVDVEQTINNSLSRIRNS